MDKLLRVLRAMFQLPFPNNQKKNFHREGTKKGFSIVEIILITVIMGGTFVSIFTLFSLALVNAGIRAQATTANFLAQEALEAARNFRDGTNWGTNGLATLTLSSDYHPTQTGAPAQWTLAAGAETISGVFTRKIVFREVQRDAADNIVTTGGTVDPDTRKATATVSWTERGRTHQVELQTYFTNWQN